MDGVGAVEQGAGVAGSAHVVGHRRGTGVVHKVAASRWIAAAREGVEQSKPMTDLDKEEKMNETMSSHDHTAGIRSQIIQLAMECLLCINDFAVVPEVQLAFAVSQQ